MMLSYLIRAEVQKVVTNPIIRVDAAAGAIKIQVPPGENAGEMQKSLEAAGFQNCRLVNEGGTSWMLCQLKPGLLERFLGKLKGVMSPQEAAFVLEAAAEAAS